VSDSEAFRDLLLAAESFIEENNEYILTPAVKPQFIDTGYTYFKAGKNLLQNGEEAVYTVGNIVEKPNLEYCKELINSGVYYCHTGMYVWQLGNIVKLWEKHQPTMMSVCRQIVGLMLSGAEKEKIAELYCQLEKITVETAITNKADKIAMSVSNRVGWSDLGKWHVIKNILCPDMQENLTKGNVITSQATNNLIYANDQEKIIVVHDVNNLVIVDTDDALFVSSLEKSADVKILAEKLKEQGLEKYL
jgi:mannose-1-phosphate guanylyltransferase